MAGWEELDLEMRGLAARPGGYVVAQLTSTPFYVQALADDRGQEALLEAVADEFLPRRQRLRPTQRRRLSTLGWREPGEPCHHPDCPLEHVNYYRFETLNPNASTALVGHLLAALAVYGATEAARIQVHSDRPR